MRARRRRPGCSLALRGVRSATQHCDKAILFAASCLPTPRGAIPARYCVGACLDIASGCSSIGTGHSHAQPQLPVPSAEHVMPAEHDGNLAQLVDI